MSSVNTKFAVLALAGSAIAVPSFGHGKHHGKHHHHNKHFFGSSGIATGTGAPYGMANATGIWGTGTAASTGFPSGHSFVHPSAVGPHTASPEVAAVDTSTCTDSVVSVTHTNRVTVTVHASSAEAAPVQTTFSTKAYSRPAEYNSSSMAFSSSVALSSSVVVESSSATASSSATSLDLDLQNKGHLQNKGRPWTRTSGAAASTSAAQSTSTTSVAAVSTKPSTTSNVVVAPTSAVAVSSSSAQASSTSSSAAPQSTGNGKRGLAYNTASLLTCFENNEQVTWAYNWDSASDGLTSAFNYVPLLWGLTNGHTTNWNSNANTAIANGATHLMSFNEPDMTSQANMSPEDAAAAYKTWMMPFAGKAKLGAPAVTNGANGMGLDWLAAFLEACDGCQIDFVAIHWYSPISGGADYFKSHVQNATDVAGGKPVWVTEFAPTGATDDQISTFLEDVMPWMDSQSYVERYSYFMAGDGALLSGTEPSTFGQTYATYSS
ncbi:glycoside hydrolase family 128 protein, partial [Aureobasidium melanogenum]